MSLQSSLVSFVERYYEKLNSLFVLSGRDRFSRQAIPTPKILLVEASDGWVVFFCPATVQYPRLPIGVTVRNHPTFNLDKVCQTYSFGLRINLQTVGDSWSPTIPAKISSRVEKKERPNDWMIMDESRRASLGDAAGRQITNISVSPWCNVETGIVKKVLPSTFTVWSPDDENWFDVWSHASILLCPDKLPLDPLAAAAAAHTDFLALSISVAASSGELSPATSQSGTHVIAADLLDKSCDELQQLVDDPTTKEEQFHQWLFEPQHWLFLHPDPVVVKSKVAFGKNVSDFVVRHSDGSYTLIEIERASLKIFQSKGEELTAEFNHSKLQVEDWRGYISRNLSTVVKELGLDDLYSPKGQVIMGNTKDIDTSTKRQRWQHHRLQVLPSTRMEAYTYDDCITRVRNFSAYLRCQCSPSPSASLKKAQTPSLLDPAVWFNRAVDAKNNGDLTASASCIEHCLRLPGAVHGLVERALRLRIVVALQNSPVEWKAMEYYSLCYAAINPTDCSRQAMHAYALLRNGRETDAKTIYEKSIANSESREELESILLDLQKPIDGIPPGAIVNEIAKLVELKLDELPA